MPNIRMQRLFNRNERVVIVAMDHCLYSGPTEGMTELAETAKKIASCVDGVLLSPAMIPHCHEAFGHRGAPQAIGRLNWSTVFCNGGNSEAATEAVFSPAEAMQLGADIALASLTLETGHEINDARNVAVFRRLCREAKKLGMPVIGEYSPVGAEGLAQDELHAKVYRGARLLAELGADAIKTLYTNNFRAVTASCPVPVFGLGGPKRRSQCSALQLAADAVKAGATGVVFGRNAVQVPNPRAFQEALCEVVKHGMAPEAAALKYQLD
jgi:DhnA family fructose-bisphosphate aldolase class Ia